MRIKSTGLGKTELYCEIESIRQQGDHLLMSVQTTKPVKWHVRIALTRADLLDMLAKGSLTIPTFLLTGLVPKKEPTLLEDY